MKIKLGVKLFIGFFLCILITVLLVSYNYYQLKHLSKMQDIGAKRANDAVQAQLLRRIGYKIYEVIANTIINHDVEESTVLWAERVKEGRDALEIMKKNADTDEEKQWTVETEGYFNKIVNLFENNILSTIKTKHNKDAKNLEEEVKNQVESYDKDIDTLLVDYQIPLRNYSDSLDKEMKKGDEDFDKSINNIIIVSIILAILGIFFAILITFIITKIITTPINKIVKQVNEIANGNLDIDVLEIKSRDELRILADAFNKMSNSLNNLLTQVNVSVEQVAVGSEQVSAASQSLSQGATEQASSLEEITSSMGEINSQTIQNSDNANKANDLANHAMENAKNGNEQMAELVKSMSTINKSAQEIKKIVKTIDDIAFQINLLALNANVEAARAGKYGKGFAVVADEVRNLAVRSTSSVKETTEMVEEATRNVEEGNKLVELTAKQLEEILASSSKVAVLVEEIASASKEQTQGVEQVNIGLEQVDQVTQSATASAEECASTSEELASQAQQLKAMLQNFKLRETKDARHIEDISPELLEAIRHKLIEEKKTINPTLTSHKVDLKKTQKVEIRKDNQKENQKKIVDPKDVISLEDSDFGKF